MKINFKRHIYITVELVENVDRQRVTTAFRQIMDPEFKDFVSSIRVRKSVRDSLSKAIGFPVTISFVDELDLMKDVNQKEI